jgi:hypothetical protein
MVEIVFTQPIALIMSPTGKVTLRGPAARPGRTPY